MILHDDAFSTRAIPPRRSPTRCVCFVLIAIWMLFHAYAPSVSAENQPDTVLKPPATGQQAGAGTAQGQLDIAPKLPRDKQGVTTTALSFSDSLLQRTSDDINRFVALMDRVARTQPPIQAKLIGLPTWMGYVLLVEGLLVIGLLGWLAFQSGGLLKKRSAETPEVGSATGGVEESSEIGWLGSLRGSLQQRVQEATAQLPEADWEQLRERAEYLRTFRNTVEELQANMAPDGRASFAVLVKREMDRPLQRLRDLLTLREIQDHPEDPALLIKGALLSDELLDAAALQALLRRTRPGQMIRYFLPELDKRLTERDSRLAQQVYDALVPLCSGEVQLLTARPGDPFDTSQQYIVDQDTTSAQPRNRIVRYIAHGLLDRQTGTVDIKTKVIIAG